MSVIFAQILLGPLGSELTDIKINNKKEGKMRMNSAKSHASDNKNRHSNNKTVVNYSFRDLCSSRDKENKEKTKDQLQWLENIVNGFEHYRFENNELFVNDEEDSLQNTKKSQVKYLKNFQIIKISPKNKKNPPVDSNRSKSTSKTVLRERKLSKNQTKTNEAQSDVKKGVNAKSSLKEKTFGGKKVVAQTYKPAPSCSSKQNKENKKIVLVKEADDDFKIFENVNTEIEKKLGKNYNGELHSKIAINRKATTIKAARKNMLFDSPSKGNVKKVGKIVRNKSIENSTLPAKKCEKTFENFIQMPEVLTEQLVPHQMNETQTKYPSEQLPQQKQPSTCRKEHDPRQILRKELEFKKYEYYIDNAKKQEKKKQRRLNSSVGDKSRRNLQNYSTSKLPDRWVSHQKTRVKTQQGNFSLKKTHQKQENSTEKKLCVSHLCDEERKNPSFQRNTKEQFSKSFSEKIKDVKSVQNSHFPCQERSQMEKTANKRELIVKREKNYDKSDWNILQIFSRLDSRKNGVLDYKNCSIQSLSREIRYIMGPILEQILYRKAVYTIGEFIQKSDKILDKIKESNLDKEIINYMEIKEYAPMTKRAPSFDEPELMHEKYKKEFYKNAVSHGNTEENSQISIISQKYQFDLDHETDSRLDEECTVKNNKGINQENKKKQSSVRPKQYKNNVRFATFQNQTEEENEENERQRAQDKFFIKKNKYEMEKKLERELENLNSFRASNDLIAKIRLKSQSSNTEPIRNDEEEMAKLELLNQKLEKYLIEQSLKEMSSSNNFQSESFVI